MRIFIYFSWSNNTKKIVDAVSAAVKGDVVRLERKTPYSTDYNTCAYVEAKEEYEKKIHPEIKDLNIDFSKYDEIDLFFPIWWYTFPMPVGTLIEKLKGYQGKIVVFANSYTNDYTYMTNSLRDLRLIDPNINFGKGLLNKSVKAHIEYLGGKTK